jgi:hypothetical protein
MSGNAGILIPVVAIISVFAVPVTAIIMGYRSRRLQSQERIAMIEKGMVPPEVDENVGGAWASRQRDPASQRARSLREGTILLALGMGMAAAFYVLNYVMVDSFLPPPARGGLAIGACIVGFLGVGNLVYYALSGKKEQ